MPDSAHSFLMRSVVQSIRDRQSHLEAVRRIMQQQMEAEAREEAVPEGFVNIGSIADNSSLTFTCSASGGPYTINYVYDSTPWISEPARATPTPEVPEDPTNWWGYCGHNRCTCMGGMCFRDRNYSQVIPGTNERRGYCITLKRTGRRRTFKRFWQANTENRARAYQGHFFPDEKIVSVRRVQVRNNGTRVETYIPEQVNVMLPGVDFRVDESVYH